MDLLDAAAAKAGLEPAEARVPVRGDLPAASGKRSKAALYLTRRGLHLVGADADGGTAIHDLLQGPVLRYRRGRLTHRLVHGDVTVTVSLRRAARARELIAAARVRSGGARPPMLRASRYLEPTTDLERDWLGAFLRPKEPVLAWLETRTSVVVDSPVGDAETISWRFLMTNERMALVALGPFGDVELEELATGRLWVRTDRRRRAVRHVDAVQWEPTSSNVDRFDELADAAHEVGPARVREVARRNWLARDDAEGALGTSRWLLDTLHRGGDGFASFASFLIGEELGETAGARTDVTRAVTALASEPARSVADLWQSWDFGTDAGTALLSTLRAGSAEPWALELHRRLHDRYATRADDTADAIERDVDLARHLHTEGDSRQARQLLERRLLELPSESVEDLLPPDDADLTSRASGRVRRARIRLHETLAEVGDGDADRCAELATLEPLVADRIRAVADQATGDLRTRAEEVWATGFTLGGLTREKEVARTDDLQPISEALLEDRLRHPMALEGHPLGWLQSMLATVELPPYGILRDYCERLDESKTDARQALVRAARVLGVDRVEGYISRGRKEVGVRAYEAEPPFVLVGGRHFDSDSPFFLTRPELEFAVGAEVAHLRFGHSRVTSREVWTGAMDKSRQGIDLVLALLPALKGWQAADRVISKIRTPGFQRLLKGANVAGDVVKKRIDASIPAAEVDPDALSLKNEDIVAAHRVMQLTADRAGLVICGDLHAAIRAMFLVRRDYAAALPSLENDGLVSVLRQRADDGHMAYLDLALRIGALIAFYLSDDFPALNDAVCVRRLEPPS